MNKKFRSYLKAAVIEITRYTNKTHLRGLISQPTQVGFGRPGSHISAATVAATLVAGSLKKFTSIAVLCGLCVVLAACNRERATPTALPAALVRPEQPTPVYGASTNFTLATVEPVFTGTGGISATVALSAPLTQDVVLAPVTPQPASTSMNQTPTALGIVQGGAVLVEKPNGRALAHLPTGATVTVTGKSADGRYLAVFTEQGNAGWIAVGQLMLFGADGLVIVPATTGPGPIATLLAEAMQPVTITMSASLSATTGLTLPMDVLGGSTVTP